ncbi:hypothetical protein ANRL4_01522 [Anaerolineae bacterium]|nr:hypothetical protein ANRL4_01522 [Anaerolineae bacterium]
MEDVKARVKALMHEIEFTHLKKDWVERLITGGIEREDAYKWVAEIGHVVDEYERSLRLLLGLLQENDIATVARKLESWLAYTRDMSIWKLEDATKELQGHYEKYLPSEPEDKEEPS